MDSMHQFVGELNEIKDHYGIGGEFGWKSVIDWFADCDDLLFRCVVVNKSNGTWG